MKDHLRYPNASCVICKKEFYRRPSELVKYPVTCCASPCRSILYKSRAPSPNLDKGRAWNKGMSKAKGDVLSYGKPRADSTKQLISQRLKEVLVKTGTMNACVLCAKEYYVFPSNTKRGNGRYCSKRCATLVRNMRQREKNTDIEIIMESWLNENNIPYQKQIPIQGISICDFLIEPNIALYCDGDYWHELPKVKKRDIWINRALELNGYKVIRILGSDIMKGVRPFAILQ